MVIICSDVIDNKFEKKNVITHIKKSGKEIVDITESQVNQFAGNMLQAVGKDEVRYTIMSEAAYRSLTKEQILQIEKHATILYSNLSTIETAGGGIARCMMAEVFLAK